MIVLVMGVSGSGKTTIGERVAERLGWRFIEGDDYHPARNVAQMASGVPLDDADRGPWLKALNKLARSERNAVLACSALKERYRAILFEGVREHRIAYLHGSRELLERRVAGRKHRYMPASLLESQLAALEPPRSAIAVDVSAGVDECVEAIVQAVAA